MTKTPTRPCGNKPILVLRFSALGDVALTIPVFRTLESAFPDCHFILVTRKRFAGLFASLTNVTVEGIDLSRKSSPYRGGNGMLRLHRHLSKLEFDQVIDLHNVLRTKALRALFKASGKATHTYDKQRKIKKSMISGQRPLRAMPHTVQQYLDAFDHLGGVRELAEGPWLHPDKTDLGPGKHILVAPFSKHASKEWPHTRTLIEQLNQRPDVTVHCLAFGKREQQQAQAWATSIEGMRIVDQALSMEGQLSLLASSDLVVSMDSANMHLACIVGTPTVSIWAATSPLLGYAPLMNGEGVVEVSKDYEGERPLSRYGKFKARKALDLAHQAMASIGADRVLEKIDLLLES